DAYAPGAAADRCGACRLCSQACPTAAIKLNRRVDAAARLSFQSSENGEAKPEHLRPAMANLASGCDVCRDGCPPTPTAQGGGARIAARAVAALRALGLAALTPAEYQPYVPGAPLGRATYAGLRRNALHARGAAREARARALCERLAEDASPKVREAALW